MRLIDADKIQYAKDWVVTDKIPKVGGYNAKAIYRVTKEEIDAMPTVDAVPVKRGYWKMVTMSEATGYDPRLSGDDPPYGHVCSVCKREARLNEEGEQILSNFCPDCGTRMDGKDGDGNDS